MPDPGFRGHAGRCVYKCATWGELVWADAYERECVHVCARVQGVVKEHGSGLCADLQERETEGVWVCMYVCVCLHV